MEGPIGTIVDPGWTVCDRYKDKKKDSDIGNKVVCKEVGVDKYCQSCRNFFIGVAGVTHVHDAGGAGNKTADRGVHEAGEKWNVADTAEVGFRVRPRAD